MATDGQRILSRMPSVVIIKFEGAAWQLEGMPEPGLYRSYCGKNKNVVPGQSTKETAAACQKTTVAISAIFRNHWACGTRQNTGRSHRGLGDWQRRQPTHIICRNHTCSETRGHLGFATLCSRNIYARIARRARAPA